jgi:hypothetical protein
VAKHSHAPVVEKSTNSLRKRRAFNQASEPREEVKPPYGWVWMLIELSGEDFPRRLTGKSYSSDAVRAMRLPATAMPLRPKGAVHDDTEAQPPLGSGSSSNRMLHFFFDSDGDTDPDTDTCDKWRILTLRPFGKDSGRRCSHHHWEWLCNGDEDVATPLLGAVSRCALRQGQPPGLIDIPQRFAHGEQFL